MCISLPPNFGGNPSKHVEVKTKEYVFTTATGDNNNRGQSDPHVSFSFLLGQAISKNKQTKTKNKPKLD